MAIKEVNELTADVIETLKSGEKKPADFLKSKDKLAAQGVDVDFVEQGLRGRGLLPNETSNQVGRLTQQYLERTGQLPIVAVKAATPAIKSAAGAIGGQRLIEALKKTRAEIGRATRGLVKGASLGYVDLPGEESPVAEFAGGIAPYIAAGPLGAAISKAKFLSAVPRLARIAGAAAQTGIVGLARPAKTPEERLKRGALEAAAGGALQAVPEALGVIGAGIKKHAPGILAKTSATPIEYIKKAMDNPKKYLTPPIDKKTELNMVSKIKDEAVKNLDDIFNFKIKTLEDEVANATLKITPPKLPLLEKELAGKGVLYPKYQAALKPQEGLLISSSGIKRAVNEYVNDMIDRGIIEKSPNAINRLMGRIDRSATKGFSDVSGKYGNIIKFKDAHALKQDLYKIMGESYGKGEFDDVVAGAYKVAAKTINRNLRELSPDYAKANDALKVIYDSYDAIGTKGMETFAGKGGTKRFVSMFNDPEGREILGNIEKVLPKEKQFMPQLLDIEETQAIRKLFTQPRTQGSLMSGGGTAGATYFATRNLPLSATLGGLAGASGSPAAIKYGIRAATALSKLKRIKAPLPGLIR